MMRTMNELNECIADPTHATLASTVENIADAVTHARFVGADQASDGVVLMKIIQVLRTLMLSPEGSALTNENVCEVMLSCFRICFEPRLNELLRRTAEHALKDIILLLFMRLPQFSEERSASGLIKKLKMVANSGGGIEQTTKRRKTAKTAKPMANKQPVRYTPSSSTASMTLSVASANSAKSATSPTPSTVTSADEPMSPNPSQWLSVPDGGVLSTTPVVPVLGNIVDMQGKFMQSPECTSEADAKAGSVGSSPPQPTSLTDESLDNDADVEENDSDANKTSAKYAENVAVAVASPVDADPNAIGDTPVQGEDFVNSMGVRFTPQSENGAFCILNFVQK